MFTKESIKNYLTVVICATALVGVAMHDTKLDKLAAVGIGASAVAALHLGGDALARLTDATHTHVERISLKNLALEPPRLQKRYLEEKEHLGNRGVPKGHRPFDNMMVPII